MKSALCILLCLISMGCTSPQFNVGDCIEHKREENLESWEKSAWDNFQLLIVAIGKQHYRTVSHYRWAPTVFYEDQKNFVTDSNYKKVLCDPEFDGVADASHKNSGR